MSPCRTARGLLDAVASEPPCWRKNCAVLRPRTAAHSTAIRDLCNRVNARARSMGIALTSCTVPHVGKPTFDLPEDEMELGVGIHGEPGRKRTKLLPADEIVELLMEPLLNDLPFKSGDEVLLFVNGLGGTPTVELFIVYRKAAEIAKRAGLKVTRNLVGSYITSLEMAGTSITLLKLDEELTLLWDSPVQYPGPEKGNLMNSISSANIEAWLRRCAEVFVKHQDELTELDAKIGDADHGVNMARGFSAIPPKLDSLVDRSIGSLFAPAR